MVIIVDIIKMIIKMIMMIIVVIVKNNLTAHLFIYFSHINAICRTASGIN